MAEIPEAYRDLFTKKSFARPTQGRRIGDVHAASILPLTVASAARFRARGYPMNERMRSRMTKNAKNA
jgi:hypothetical protein